MERTHYHKADIRIAVGDTVDKIILEGGVIGYQRNAYDPDEVARRVIAALEGKDLDD